MKKNKYELMPIEFFDVVQVLEFGAKKYGAYSWLNGKDFDFDKNNASLQRHLIQARDWNHGITDDESGLNHYLHIACRALMMYTIQKRNQALDKAIPDNWGPPYISTLE